jgi:hypothetical protein
MIENNSFIEILIFLWVQLSLDTTFSLKYLLLEARPWISVLLRLTFTTI